MHTHDADTRTLSAVDQVLQNSDLVSLILRKNIGPSSFAAVRLVCKTWLTVCETDKLVLRGVALYQGVSQRDCLCVVLRSPHTKRTRGRAMCNGDVEGVFIFYTAKVPLTHYCQTKGFRRGGAVFARNPRHPGFPRRHGDRCGHLFRRILRSCYTFHPASVARNPRCTRETSMYLFTDA